MQEVSRCAPQSHFENSEVLRNSAYQCSTFSEMQQVSVHSICILKLQTAVLSNHFQPVCTPNQQASSQVRARKGVSLQDGIDSLLVGLLTDLDAVPELESFVSGVTHVAVTQVAAGLQQGSYWHALALLHAAKGDPEAALQIWQVKGMSIWGCVHCCRA